jgi:hypothetical protein
MRFGGRDHTNEPGRVRGNAWPHLCTFSGIFNCRKTSIDDMDTEAGNNSIDTVLRHGKQHVAECTWMDSGGLPDQAHLNAYRTPPAHNAINAPHIGSGIASWLLISVMHVHCVSRRHGQNGVQIVRRKGEAPMPSQQCCVKCCSECVTLTQ